MDDLDILICLVAGVVGAFFGWVLRSQRAIPERLRLVAHFEGRTKLAEQDLESAQRELSESRLSVQRTQAEYAQQSTRVPKLKRELQSLTKQLAEARRELEQHKQLLARLTQDDLSRLPGVGPVLASRLKEVGVAAYQDLAGLDEAGLVRLAEELNLPLRTIKRHDWPKHAAKLMEERPVISS